LIVRLEMLVKGVSCVLYSIKVAYGAMLVTTKCIARLLPKIHVQNGRVDNIRDSVSNVHRCLAFGNSIKHILSLTLN
jgi:hypothetical protein